MAISYEKVVSALGDGQVPAGSADICLGAIDRTKRIAIGRSGSGAFVFVGPQQPGVTALLGTRFEFNPATSLSPVDSEEPLEDVCVLRFEPVDVWDGLVPAVAALFTGLASTGRVTPQDLGPAVHALQGLFEADLRSRVPRDVEIGLAGELLAISCAQDRAAMAERWHSAVDATFDFSATGERLDVKTTTGLERVHWMSSSQVGPIPGVCQSFLSVMLPVVEVGATVRDMFSSLEDLPDSLVARVRSIIVDTTGEPPETLTNLHFDLVTAQAAMLHIKASDVPAPMAVPGVRRIRWEAEFTPSVHRLLACNFAEILGR